MIKKSSYRIKNHKTTLINNFIPFGNPRSDLLIFRMIFLFAANAIYILLKHDNELKILCRSDSNMYTLVNGSVVCRLTTYPYYT